MLGRKPEISESKINAIFDLVRKNKFKNIIARTFNINEQTLSSWVDKGEEHLRANEDLNNEIIDLYLHNQLQIDDLVSENMETYKEDYCKKFNKFEITDKDMFRFNEWLREQKVILFESICKKQEHKLIDKYIFSPIEEENLKIREYIKFSRAFRRGQIACTNFLQENVDKHAASSKNVALSWKLLEKTEAESYMEKPQKVDHTHSGEIILIDHAKAWEKYKKKEDENKKKEAENNK